MERRRIMYIEDKSHGRSRPGRIGLVVSSRSGRTLTWGGRRFLRVGSGYKYNHIELETGAPFWISGPRRDGADGLYGRIRSLRPILGLRGPQSRALAKNLLVIAARESGAQAPLPPSRATTTTRFTRAEDVDADVADVYWREIRTR